MYQDRYKRTALIMSLQIKQVYLHRPNVYIYYGTKITICSYI